MANINVRIGLTPVKLNLTLGAIRTHVYNIAIALSNDSENSIKNNIVIRCDDTNKLKNDYTVIDTFIKLLKDKISLDLTNVLVIKQSERNSLYNNYFEILKRTGFIETENDSEASRINIEKYIMNYGDSISFNDALKGTITFKINFDEKIMIRRKNGSFLYNFTSAIDDGDLNITHIVRGNDMLSTVISQEIIRKLCGFPKKIYLHLPLLNGWNKIENLVYYEDFLKNGYTPVALNSYIISSGYSDPNIFYNNIGEFLENFDYKKIHKNNSSFDIDKLNYLNKKSFKSMNDIDYIKFFTDYLTINNNQDLCSLLNDKKILKLVLVSRRSFVETKNILNHIKNNNLDISKLSGLHIELLKKISGKKVGDLNELLKILNGNEKKIAIETIRFVLTGEVYGIDISVLLDIFSDKII